MTIRRDVLVVGAGPAGAVAAMVAAAGGRTVALVERECLPRYKACGGGVVERALAALPCRRPTPDDLPMVAVRRLLVAREGDDPILVDCARMPVLMIMRAEFDHYLVERAREAGADLFQGTAVSGVRQEGDAFVCSAGAGEFRARFLVGADGTESRVAHVLSGAEGADGLRCGVALEGEVKHLSPSPELTAGEARFDFQGLRDGYGWVFPKRHGFSVGVFTRSARHPSLRADYRRYAACRRMGPDRVEETRLTGHRIPVAPRRRRARGGLLLAGDAAGLVDPLTGEGISFAIRSGRMAGEAILAAGNRPGQAAGLYEALLAREILPEIRTARVLAALLHGLPRTAFRTLGRCRRFPELVAEMFAGKGTYRALVRRALRRPWRLLSRD